MNEIIDQLTIESQKYLADYINEELSRGNEITYLTILDAIDAFKGGAR